MTLTSSLKKYTRNIAVCGVLLAIASSFGQYFWPNLMHPLWFIELLFIVMIQWMAFAYVQKFGQDKIRTLLKHYQIAKFVKMFVYLIALVVYVFTIKNNAFQFLINFMAYYVVFVSLETWFLHHWMRSLNQTSTNE